MKKKFLINSNYFVYNKWIFIGGNGLNVYIQFSMTTIHLVYKQETTHKFIFTYSLWESYESLCELLKFDTRLNKGKMISKWSKVFRKGFSIK